MTPVVSSIRDPGSQKVPMVTYYPDARSRYKDTPLVRIADSPGSEVFITYDQFVPPQEFASKLNANQFTVYTVSRMDVGFPDRIAWLCWGAGMEPYWWIIAMVNGIIDPETDLFPGQQLLVPVSSLLQLFLSRAPSTLEIQGVDILTFANGTTIFGVI